MQPPASSVRTSPPASMPSPTAVMRPSSPTSTSARREPVSSTTVPPRISSSPMGGLASLAEEQEQDGHAHGDAVGDLAGDDGAGQVGDLGGDLDAAVHGPGVHDEGVVAEQPRPLPGESVERRVLPQAGQQRLGLALLLHAEQVDDV